MDELQNISIHAPRGGSDLVVSLSLLSSMQFQSTLPVGGATLKSELMRFLLWISIHAPRGGSDLYQFPQRDNGRISIHAPRGGSDKIPLKTWARPLNFNPRSPWGERRSSFCSIPCAHFSFQSTLPVGGATRQTMEQTRERMKFQSTLPVGGATHKSYMTAPTQAISIHAPRGGSDK